MKSKKKKYRLIKIFICGILIFGIGGITAQAKTFVYPPTKHSVKEMYEKGTDFAGGNPGKPGNPGKRGHSGKKGVSGKKGNPGKKGKRGSDGKGRLVIVW